MSRNGNFEHGHDSAKFADPNLYETRGKFADQMQRDFAPEDGWSPEDVSSMRPSTDAVLTEPARSLVDRSASSPLSHAAHGRNIDTALALSRVDLMSKEAKRRRAHVDRLKKKGMSEEDAVAAMHAHWEESGKKAAFDQRLRDIR